MTPIFNIILEILMMHPYTRFDCLIKYHIFTSVTLKSRPVSAILELVEDNLKMHHIHNLVILAQITVYNMYIITHLDLCNLEKYVNVRLTHFQNYPRHDKFGHSSSIFSQVIAFNVYKKHTS